MYIYMCMYASVMINIYIYIYMCYEIIMKQKLNE